jgi:hypothetical protein
MQGTMILAAVIAYEVIRRRAQAAAVHEAAHKVPTAPTPLAGAAS